MVKRKQTARYIAMNLPKESIEYKAYTSVRGQRERCDNPNNKAYKHYGAKGIKVEYSNEDFLKWWKIEASKYPLNSKLTVDRIDTNKNYCFNNIRLIPWSENVKRSNKERIVNYYAILDWDSLAVLHIVTNMEEVSKITGMCINTVWRHCNFGRGIRNSRNTHLKYTVRYSNEREYRQRGNIQKACAISASEDTEDCGVYHSASIYPGNPGSFGFN